MSEHPIPSRSQQPAQAGVQVLHIADVNDLDAIDRAVAAAKSDPARPSLIVTRTHIGFGSPNRQDSAKAHGEPLGAEEIRLAREALGWPHAPFVIPKADSAFSRHAEIHDTTIGWRFVNPKMEAMHGTLAMGETAEKVADKLGRRPVMLGGLAICQLRRYREVSFRGATSALQAARQHQARFETGAVAAPGERQLAAMAAGDGDFVQNTVDVYIDDADKALALIFPYFS